MIFIGDTHGNHRYYKQVIKDKDIRNTTLIHVGDFGVGFIDMGAEERNLEELNNWLLDRGLTLHVIRGNHDNPNYFKGKHIYTNLKLHTDYTVINVEGKNILLVGGATSIDRVPRRRYNLQEARVGRDIRYHWEDEKFVLDREKLEGMRDINIVVTHTAPHYAKPFDVKGQWPYIVAQFMGEDERLGDDLVAERTMLDEMYDILDKNNHIDDWFYGHFHRNDTTLHKSTLFHLLDINEMYEHKDEYGDDFEQEMNDKYGED